MALSKSTISALVLGGVTLASLLALYYLLNSGQTPKAPLPVEDEEESDGSEGSGSESESDNEGEEHDNAVAVPQQRAAESTPSSAPRQVSSVTVDEGSDDEAIQPKVSPKSSSVSASASASAPETSAASTAEIKAQFEAIMNTARKLMTGSKFEKAAEKYTEALALLPAVPNMTPKDSLALYNNRSAMLEKCGQYDKALEDISVVLSMDRFHVKALTRRGRIYENQQKPREALHDYVLATLLEQTQGRAPDCAPRIDDLAKQIAVAHAQEAVVTLGTSPARDLPGQSYCRSFFETFQSYHEGKEASKSWDRASLERQLSNAADASHAHLALTLAQLLIARDEYSAALAVVDEALEFFCRTQMKHAVVHHGGEVSADKLWSFMEQNLSMMMDVTSLLQSETDHEHHHHDHHHHPAPHHHSQSHSLRSALAQLIDMRANGLHLRCDFTGARRGYDLSIAMDGGHCVEPLLKLASIKVELGDAGKADEEFDKIFAHLDERESSGSKAEAEASDKLRAWVLIHRAALFISRNRPGGLALPSIERSLADLDASIAITNPVARACRLLAIVKHVQIQSQFKQLAGAMMTPEELDSLTERMEEAKAIDAKHDGVLQLDIELKTLGGSPSEAIALCDSWIASEASNPMPYLLKANLLTQMAFAMMQQERMDPKAIFEEVDALFEQAIAAEPNGVEAIAQMANLKTMLGNPLQAVALTERAMPIARSFDEIQDIAQIHETATAQLVALRALNIIA